MGYQRRVHGVSFYIYVSLCLCLFLCAFSLPVSLSVSWPVSLCVSSFVSIYIFHSASLCSFFLSLRLSLSVSFCVCVSISDFVSVCFSDFVEPSLPAVKWLVGFFSVLSFYVRFWDPSFYFSVRFLVPLIRQPIMDGFQHSRCLWKCHDQTLQYMIFKILETKN